MVADLYCSHADLYRHGFSRGMLANPGRLVAEVSASTDAITLDGHGFASGDVLLFRVEDGGTMPAPLVAGTSYYALPLTDSTFQASATDGGAAVNFTTAGSDVIVSTSLDATIDHTIEHYSRLADTYCPGHEVPFTAGSVPAVVRGFVAEMSAAALCQIQGQASEIQAAKMARCEKEFARLAKGIPLRDAAATSSANLAVVASATTVDARTGARGWSSRNSSGTDVLP
jgi:hypothetical protein